MTLRERERRTMWRSIIVLVIANRFECLKRRSKVLGLQRGGSVEEVDCLAVANECREDFAVEARHLASQVRNATTPISDFGLQALRAVRTAMASFDAQTLGVPGSGEARSALLHDLGDDLESAHAEHVAALRSHAARLIRTKLEALDDLASCAAVAADVDLSFRSQVDLATPSHFLNAWQPTLDSALDALQDDIKDAIDDRASDFLLHSHSLDDDDATLEEEDDDDVDDNTGLLGRIRSTLRFFAGNPRLLRTAGFLLNVVQARAAIRAAQSAAHRRDDSIPKLPLF